jgi:hypothetical protein
MIRRYTGFLVALMTAHWSAPAPVQAGSPGAASPDTVTPVSWSLLIEAGTAGAHDSLGAFGVRADATAGYDPAYDSPCPPSPPGVFIRVYFPHEGGGWPSMLGDKFATDFTSPQSPAWRMVVETNAGPGTVTLQWDTSEVGALPDSYFLLMEDSAADSLIRLRETDGYSFAYDGPRVFLVGAEFASTFIDIAPGWNIVSVPRIVADSSVSSLFPGGISPAFDFDTAYHPRDSMSVGRGYWLKFASAAYAAVTGLSVDALDVPVREGWNMIGVPSVSVIPPSTPAVLTPFYEYSAGYRAADTLVPGKGYWVKVSADGLLALGAGWGASRPASVDDAGGVPASVTVSSGDGGEATLFLLSPGAAVLPDRLDLPPPPPAPAFDARFSAGGAAAILPERPASSREYVIAVQTAGTSIMVSASAGSTGAMLFTETGPDQWGAITDPSEPVALTRGPGRTFIRIRASAPSDPPAGFALAGNYPNPFNPSTQIRYRLPSAADVTIRVADMGGRTVFATPAIRQPGGDREFRLDAGGLGLASGIYLYTVEAAAVGSGLRYRGGGKMVYLK